MTNKFWNIRNIIGAYLIVSDIIALLGMVLATLDEGYGVSILWLIFSSPFFFFTYYVFKQDENYLLDEIRGNEEIVSIVIGFILGLIFGWPVMFFKLGLMVGIFPIMILTYILFKTLKPKSTTTLFLLKLTLTIALILFAILIFVFVPYYNHYLVN